MSEFHDRRCAEIIDHIIYITIATASKDGIPWNSPVYSRFDENLNFYWSSDREAQHSRNIHENPHIFLAIYDSTVPEGTGEGAYIEAEAIELAETEEIQVTRRVTQKHKGMSPKEHEYEKFTGSSVRRVYKATPKRAWMNDVENDEQDNYIRDIRIEVPLDAIKQHLNKNTETS